MLDGQPRVGVDKGSLGRSANGKAPIFDADEQVIGEVSVGVLEKEVGASLRHEILDRRSVPRAGAGRRRSRLVAARPPHQARDVRPRAVRDHLAAAGTRGDAARHPRRCRSAWTSTTGSPCSTQKRTACSKSPPNRVGQPLDAVVPPGRLRDLLSGRIEGTDEVALTDEFLLVVNRMPVVLGGRAAGAVVTLRDRTELESLIRELNAVTGLTNALRAQEHEFTNRLHVLSGLLELGDNEEATHYRRRTVRRLDRPGRSAARRASHRLWSPRCCSRRSPSPPSRASTCGSARTAHLEATPEEARTVLTVLGNLVDNAIEAVAATSGPGTVRHRTVRRRRPARRGRRHGPRGRPQTRSTTSSATGTRPSPRVGRCGADLGWHWYTGWCGRRAARSRSLGGPDAGSKSGCPRHGSQAVHAERDPRSRRPNMISTLVVDDDFRVARIHATSVDRVDGFHLRR